MNVNAVIRFCLVFLVVVSGSVFAQEPFLDKYKRALPDLKRDYRNWTANVTCYAERFDEFTDKEVEWQCRVRVRGEQIRVDSLGVGGNSWSEVLGDGIGVQVKEMSTEGEYELTKFNAPKSIRDDVFSDMPIIGAHYCYRSIPLLEVLYRPEMEIKSVEEVNEGDNRLVLVKWTEPSLSDGSSHSCLLRADHNLIVREWRTGNEQRAFVGRVGYRSTPSGEAIDSYESFILDGGKKSQIRQFDVQDFRFEDPGKECFNIHSQFGFDVGPKRKALPTSALLLIASLVLLAVGIVLQRCRMRRKYFS